MRSLFARRTIRIFKSPTGTFIGLLNTWSKENQALLFAKKLELIVGGITVQFAPPFVENSTDQFGITENALTLNPNPVTSFVPL